jgi:Fe-S cluster biogenesis protein NfuA
MANAPGRLLEVLRTVLAPLVEADGGQLYVVTASEKKVQIHLAGTCCGCPGARQTTEQVIEPAVRAVSPEAEVEVTTGWIIPESAERVEAAGS